ncbi:MAG: flagellar biosynthesis protein FlgB [Acidothermus cellulolyticus]|uniref:flagellar basal body rod protein FlgB n=1 Tax=Acidothermus cellulolyticus TaxID=28049 RepID=UPI0002D31F37|nr:flagellar biosynthesis protein FlgB [Acidothermus cellulolyticus]MBX5447057.1 flagellar biosynthesis protein FlgB [Acidothermus cellulolyticus]MCL6550436.1 flagellar biosynthesis protein FlgB [Acidothermus cellulolyticus]
MFDDLTTQALEVSIAGLSARQRALADNVANIDTPNFLAKRVVFEDSLKAAIASGDPGAAQITTLTSLEPTNTNGNNVNLDEETVSAIDTGLKYQTDIEALTAKYQLLKTAIGSP